MIVRTLDDVRSGPRDVRGPTFESRRLALRADGLGFSFHDTVLFAGTETRMRYAHHVEAVYCIEGEGEVEDLDAGGIHRVRPGTFYAVDGHERHVLRARTALRMICVFRPALVGGEVHDETGAYPLIGEDDSDAA